MRSRRTDNLWRTLLASQLVVCTLLAGCKDPPPYIDPTRFAQAGTPTTPARPRLFGQALATGEPLPDDVAVRALQQGYFCLDLPVRSRTRLLPMRGDGHVRVLERDEQQSWQVTAVDLASHTATVEQAMGHDTPMQLWRMQQGWLALTVTPTDDDAVPTILPQPPTPTGQLRWFHGAEVVQVALGVGDIASVVVGPHGDQLWYVRMPQDQTPTLWQTALEGATPPRQIAEAAHVWMALNDGQLLVIRGQGAAEVETQVLDPATGQRWRIGPDAEALQAVGDGIIVQTRDGRLVGIDEWPGVEVPLPGAHTGDQLLTWGGQPAVSRREPSGVEMLLWFDGRTLRRVAALTPTRWLAAEPLRGGVVAALIGRDSDLDGTVDPMLDQALVCIVARAVNPLTVQAGAGPRQQSGPPATH